jgi:LCP family protein required for cell wall assembly
MNKMKKRPNLIDGFTPRRSAEKLGDLHTLDDKKTLDITPDFRPMQATATKNTFELGKADIGRELGRLSIEESLDDDFFKDSNKKLSRKEKKLLKKINKKPKSIVKRIIKWFILLIVLSGLGYAVFLGYRFIIAGGNVFQGSIFNLIKNDPLKQDVNGRSNFLILGTSEDDPDHEGAVLTDSMMIVSIDQTKKDAYMFSIPRDLYVKFGMACNAGYQGKINEYFNCSNSGDTAEAEQDRLAQTQALIGDIFGLDIQYGVHINQTVIKQVVDAVDGIDVDIQGSNGDDGVLDRNFDWRCNYECYYVQYDNGIHHLDGEHALYLSMARGHSAPTYGLSRSNFDREINQQKILMAFKEKAMSSGMITNLGAISKIITALGENLRTNIKTEEIRTIAQLAGDIKSTDFHTISLVSEGESVMTTGMYGEASVVMPVAGIFEYDQIREFVKNNLVYGQIFVESAPIVVLNGSGQVGLGQNEADKLTDNGFNVVLVGNAPDGEYLEKVEIYQIGDGNTVTAKALSDKFGVTIKTSKPPTTVNGNVKFVIIFGQSDQTSN